MILKNSVARYVFALGPLTIALAFASPARATDCTKNSDCSKGFACLIFPSVEPVVSPPACAKDAADCPSAAPAPTPSSTPAPVTGVCEQGPCTTDTDCGAGMLCHTSTSSECTGGTTEACAKGVECPPPPPSTPPVCTETKTSTCAYKWQLPCNTASDCGDGFNCEASVTATCSGGGAAGTVGATSGGGSSSNASGAPAGTVAPTPPDSCTTTTSFPGFCSPKATTCKVDADCPTIWTCTTTSPPRAVEPGTPVATSGVETSTSTGVATPGSASSHPNEPAVTPAPTPTTTMACTPPGYASPAGVDVGTTIGTGETPTSGGKGGGTPTTPTPTTSTPAEASNGSTASTPSAGCAIGGGGSSLGLIALGLVGLALARRRRSR